MSELGLDPDGDGDPGVDRKAAGLRDAEYRMGEIVEEPAEEWRGSTIDLRDAHGEGMYAQVDRDQF